MLALKLLLVPAVVLAVTLIGRRWGPQVAGWMAGLPVLTGPILFILWLEQGPEFARGAANGAGAGVFGFVSFGTTYARCAQCMAWPPAFLVALAAWCAAVLVLSALPDAVLVSAAIAFAGLLAVPFLFPDLGAAMPARPLAKGDLVLRMATGVALTLIVTYAASAVGARWSGLLTVFPILGCVLAVFSHRAQGAKFAAALLRAMTVGMYAFLAFCLTLTVALDHVGAPAAFAIAVAVCLGVQAASMRHLRLATK